MGFAAGQFPVAEDYYARAISIPLYATMDDAQQQMVSDVLHRHVPT